MKKTAKVRGIELGVCGLHELQVWTKSGISHVISISDGLDAVDRIILRKVVGLFPGASVLPCFFNDVTEASASFSPTEATIRSVLEFTGALKSGDRLLVHCTAGISRSTAIAYGFMCQHRKHGCELDAYVDLRSIRPCAMPNPLVVQLADSILKRDGKMMEAIRWPE